MTDNPDLADGAAVLTDEPPIVDEREASTENRHRRAIFDLPVDVVIAVGRAHIKIEELLNLRRDSVLSLDTKVDDPVDLMVGKRVIARGQLQEIEGDAGRLGVRLTEIVDVSDPF
jgi:flagellar motor switch protein FliN/FliY